ncbi:MAG: CRISPR-associated protein Cas4 [Candidatus Pacearchaeota archaeon]
MKLINISDIANFTLCPRKVYYKLVLGKKEEMNEKIVFGKIKHKFLEEINKVEEEIISNIKKNENYENIKKRFEEKYEEIIKEINEKNQSIIEKFNLKEKINNELAKIKEEEIKIRTANIKKFVKLGFYGNELWQALIPKFLTEVEIRSFVLGIKGRIDKIEINSEEIIPYEIKSREYNNKVWLSEKLQLSGYSLLIERKFNTNVDFGFLEFKDKLVKVEIKNWLREKLIQLKDEIYEILKTKSIPEPTKNKNICMNCNFNSICFKDKI